MTENQEKELFNILGTLVTEVREVKLDVQNIKVDVQNIKKIQDEHSRILNEHSQALTRLEGRTDRIAEIVINNDKRLTNIEKEVEDLRSSIH
jgi:chromosome segregation ATPase